MADQGFGISIAFQSGFCAAIEEASFPGFERAAIETTNSATAKDAQGQAWGTFIPSDISYVGELEVTIQFNPNLPPPVNKPAETITVTYPIPIGGNSAATVACSGFMMKMGETIPIKDKMMAKVTLKFSGIPTFTTGT